MTGIEIGQMPAPLPDRLRRRLTGISFATIGHHLDEGFVDPAIQRQTGQGRVVGRAITVRTTAQDSTLLQHAAGTVEPGDVLVIDTGGDVRHAPVGLVIAAAARVRGAAGVVIDGVMTDVDEVGELDFPVFSRGRSLLTTKQLGLPAGGLNISVVCGGVVVEPGAVVLGDANGVFIAGAAVLDRVIDQVEDDDRTEPAFIASLADGVLLGDDSGATAIIERLSRRSE